MILMLVLLGILYLLWAGFEKLRRVMSRPVSKVPEKPPVTGYAKLPEKYRVREPLYDGVPFDQLPDEISNEQFKAERTAEVKKALGPRYARLLESATETPVPKAKKALIKKPRHTRKKGKPCKPKS